MKEVLALVGGAWYFAPTFGGTSSAVVVPT